jgi:hypothetical protein
LAGNSKEVSMKDAESEKILELIEEEVGKLSRNSKPCRDGSLTGSFKSS